jgi:hypothetical protein
MRWWGHNWVQNVWGKIRIGLRHLKIWDKVRRCWQNVDTWTAASCFSLLYFLLNIPKRKRIRIRKVEYDSCWHIDVFKDHAIYVALHFLWFNFADFLIEKVIKMKHAPTFDFFFKCEAACLILSVKILWYKLVGRNAFMFGRLHLIFEW